ncbi:MAG: hypothetical protein AB2A00_20490 [Myxococcota bacterium]
MTLNRPLGPPWDLPSRVMGLHRRVVGEGPGVPGIVAGAAAGLAALWLERAVLDEGATGREALGGPSVPLEPLLAAHPRSLVMLTHGGPRTADTSRDRPVAAAGVVDPITGRTPLALTSTQWDGIHAALLREVEAALRAGAWGVGVEAARGHLWHSALSPLMCPDHDERARLRARLMTLVKELRGLTPRLAVSLVVEDVAVGGLPPREGVGVARELVDAGATMVIARVGGPHMVRRMDAPEPRFLEEEGPALHAGKWLRAALPGDVVVAVAGAIRTEAVVQAALEARCCDAVVVGRPLREGSALIPRASTT